MKTTVPTLSPHPNDQDAPEPAPAVPRTRQWLRHHRVFLGATAIVMLHVADDNFLQPAEGVAASDHLVSGLVPLGLLALGAWAYPRVRAGAQALIAFAVAFLGLLTGLVEAGYYAYAVGPSGDNWTGFLAGAAGLVLVGLGIRILWRSRRAGRSLTRRYLRRALFGFLAALVLSELGAPLVLSYVSTHVARADVPTPDLGARHENVTLTTSDGLRLEGWYVPSRTGAAVIAFPGRKNPQTHTRMLARHGYGVLLFDRRGEGASEGDGNMFGWGGERDLHAAVGFLKRRADVDPGRIGVLGLSVGGELALHAAAENPDIAAVVSEGAGTRSLSEEMQDFDQKTLVRGFHFLVTKHAAVTVFSNEPPPPSLVDLVPRIAPRPVLLIWAPNGGNRETMNPRYHRLIGPSASIWSIPDTRHIKGLATHPEEYERRVVGFFDRALLGGVASGETGDVTTAR